MTKLSKTKLARIEAQLKEHEEEILFEFLFESDDENISEALEQALTVVKLIFSEEINERIIEMREELIQHELEEMTRKKIENEQRKRMLKEIQDQKRRVKEEDIWEKLLYPKNPPQPYTNKDWWLDKDDIGWNQSKIFDEIIKNSKFKRNS